MNDKHIDRFWQEAYLTALRNGHSTDSAYVANQAVAAFNKYTGLVYSQNEGGNVPYPPKDDVVGCLSGAITAMELLRERLIADGIVNRCPGLDDLIERSKKALGDC